MNENGIDVYVYVIVCSKMKIDIDLWVLSRIC